MSAIEDTLLFQITAAGLPIPVREYRAIPGRRACLVCGKPLNNEQKSFCSYKCAGMSHTGKNSPVYSRIEKVCENCGKTFMAKSSGLARGQFRFCSNKCRSEGTRGANNHNWLGGKTKKNCAFCGNEYEVNKCYADRSKYCSKDCSSKSKIGIHFVINNPNRTLPRRIYKKIVQPPKKCKYCNNDVTEKGRKYYCSDKCAKLGNFYGRHIKTYCAVCGKEMYAYIPDVKNMRGKYCSMNCFMKVKYMIHKGTGHSVANGGKRSDLDNVYFRSGWEANYARYLNWLITQGEIIKWEFEPETFEFKKIKRGNKFYTPDFKIFNKDGTIEFHEVKGYMSPDSKVKLSRMAKYYPDVKIVLIDRDVYVPLSRQLRNLIPNWEWNGKHSY